jgi:MerR family mercuric resistance operon transcriptional regulator
MKIGELSRLLGLTPPTLRFYEERGLLPAPRRSSGGRVYDRKAVDHLRAVLALKRVRFTLGEIRSLLSRGFGAAEQERWKHSARAKLAEIEHEIAALEAARSILEQSLDCDCRGRAERCQLIERAERG